MRDDGVGGPFLAAPLTVGDVVGAGGTAPPADEGEESEDSDAYPPTEVADPLAMAQAPMMWALLDEQARLTVRNTHDKEIEKVGQLGPPVIAAIAASMNLSKFTVAEVCAFLAASGGGRAAAASQQPRSPPPPPPPPGPARAAEQARGAPPPKASPARKATGAQDQARDFKDDLAATRAKLKELEGKRDSLRQAALPWTPKAKALAGPDTPQLGAVGPAAHEGGASGRTAALAMALMHARGSGPPAIDLSKARLRTQHELRDAREAFADKIQDIAKSPVTQITMNFTPNFRDTKHFHEVVEAMGIYLCVSSGAGLPEEPQARPVPFATFGGDKDQPSVTIVWGISPEVKTALQYRVTKGFLTTRCKRGIFEEKLDRFLAFLGPPAEIKGAPGKRRGPRDAGGASQIMAGLAEG